MEKIDNNMKINIKKIIKVFVFFTIELIYTFIMLKFFDWINDSFGTSTLYDESLYNLLKTVLIILIWVVGPMFNKFVVMIYTSIYTMYFVSQSVYFNTFGQYYRLSTALSLKNELIGVKESAFEMMLPEHWTPFIVLLGITILFVVLYFILQRKSVKFYFTFIYKLPILFLLYPTINTNFELHMIDVMETKKQEDVFQLNKTDYYIYDVIPSVNKFVETFGLYTFFVRDYNSLSVTKEYSQEDFTKVEQYFESKPAPTSNEYTGIFEGKHVVFIQAESHIDAVVHPELTPTIYKLKTQGINVRNFNTPLLPGSTSDTEFMAMTSLIPRGDGYAVSYKYPYNEYPVTLAKVFKEKGYSADIYHNNYGNYYNRDDLFANFGYDEFFDSTRFGYEDRVSDLLIGEKLEWIFPFWEQPQLGYWITYSGHQPYILDEVGVDPQDVQKIKKLYPELDDSYVSYYAKTMDLDKSIESMLNILKNQGKIDDFVFVFLGDHMVKGLDFSKESAFYKQTGIEYNEDDFTTALYIYNKPTKGFEIDKHSTVLDLLPTICNLFNVDYDYKKTLGSDILDPTYQGMTFTDYGDWENNNFSYNANTDTLLTKNGYDEIQASNELDAMMEKDFISRLILKLNYFKQD